MRVKILAFDFICEEFIRETGDKLRGYFANKFKEYTLIHHHLENNKLLYNLPLIQYKILNGKPQILGINEGADILQKIYEEIEFLKFGNKIYPVKEKKISLKTEKFGIGHDVMKYKFLTPWLALNEENYRKYLDTNLQTRSKLLERILIGNILSIAKSLEYVVTEEIRAKVRVKATSTSLKGVPMIGFLGTFSVNFNLPDYIGLGKSVSRGFGTIKKISRNDADNKR